MATLNTLSVVLRGESSQLSSVLGRSSAEIRAFAKEASASGSAGSTALKGIGVAAGAVALGFVYAATQAAEFEKEMRNVSTIDANVRQNFARTSAQVIELSKHLPQTAKELAAGLYDISSSGFQGANSLTILKASATAASAGLSTTANSAKAITATLNAYGLQADQASRVSDTLFQTVNFGVINFDELTAVIGDTVGTAAAAGVNIEQLGSAVATLTLSGLSASEAGVSLNRVLTSLIHPNVALLQAQKQLGVSFTDDLKNPSIGLKGVLDELLQSVGGNKVAFSNLFTDIRASRGVLALEANDGKNYTRVLQEMGVASDNTGATQRALTEQAKGTSYELTILKNQFNAAAITLGEKFLPVIVKLASGAGNLGTVIGRDLVTAAHDLAPFWSDLVGVGQNLVGIFHDLWETAGPAVKVLAGATLAGVAGAFHGIGIAVKDTTGFLADNQQAVLTLIAAYAALNINTIVAGFSALGTAITGNVIRAVTLAQIAVGRLSTAITGLGTSFLGANAATASSRDLFIAGGLAATVWAGFIVDAGIALNSYSENAKTAAAAQQKFHDQLTQKVDPSSLESVNTALKTALETLRSNPRGGNTFADLIEGGRSVNSLLKEHNSFVNDKDKQGGALKGTIQAIGELQKQQHVLITTRDNTAALAKEYGLTTDKVTELAAAHKLKLDGALTDTNKTVDGHKTTVKGLVTQYDALLNTWSKTEQAADPLKKAQSDLSTANKKYADDLAATQKSWKDQIDILKDYQGQADVTAQSIQNAITKNLGLLINETANIRTLQAKGASGALIDTLVKEGPEFVAAGASAGAQTIQGWNKSLQTAGQQKALQQNLLTQSLNPADFKAKTDAAARFAFIGFTGGVEDATKKALSILSAFPPDATDTVRKGLEAQHAKVLLAFLATLDAPTRQAVEQALTAAKVGSDSIASQIVQAMIRAKPSAVFQAQDLYTKVQGELDKLHGKNLQVILDDLVSGNIPKLLDDLNQLSTAILKLPAGVAIGVPQDPLASVLKPNGGAARGGNPFSGPVRGGTSMRGDRNLIAVSPLEYVVQGPAAMMYGRAAMDSVNKGTAEVIPHFAGGGPVGDSSYSYNLTTQPLAAALASYAQRVEAKLGQVQQTIASAVSFGGSTAGGSDAAKAYAQATLRQHGWGADQWPPLLQLWAAESGWNPNAVNPSSGAAGIPQALGHGNVFALGDYRAQVDWGENYIASVYGNPAGAWAHELANHWYATGGPVDPAVSAYLKSLADQANVNAYLSALSKAKGGGGSAPSLLGFLAKATKLAPGAHDLAVRGLQDAYGMPSRNSTWDQATTDFLAVNSPHVGATSDAIKYLQLAIKRPATGRLTTSDLPQLGKVVNAVGFPGGDTTFGALIHGDANQTLFQQYLQTIIRRGYAPLAGYLNQQGADTALAGARQLAGAPVATLERANAAAIRQSTTTKFGDALTLAQQLASYGGKVGLLGLASRSGTSVADVLGLVTSYPDVFSAVGSSGKLLAEDLKRIASGLQPVAAYAGGAWEIKQDHIATVHKGETVLPAQYAEPWRQHAAGGRSGGGGIALTFEAGAIPVTVGDVASMGQVRSEVKRAIGDSLGTVVSRALSRTGSR